MKKRGKQKEEVKQEVVPIEKVDKSVISPEEVGEVISGDEVALAEQMERTKALTKEQQEEYKFFSRFSFNTSEEFLEWRQFFYDHFYDWQPKCVNKKAMEREFAWFNLQWGLKSDFTYEQIIDHDNALKKNK